MFVFAAVIRQLIGADDITFRDDVPVIRLAVNDRDFIGWKLEDFKRGVRPVQRRRRAGKQQAANYHKDTPDTTDQPEISHRAGESVRKGTAGRPA